MSAYGKNIDLNHRTWILHSFIGWVRHPHVSLRKHYWLSLCGNLQIIDPTIIGYVPECRHSGTSNCAEPKQLRLPPRIRRQDDFREQLRLPPRIRRQDDFRLVENNLNFLAAWGEERLLLRKQRICRFFLSKCLFFGATVSGGKTPTNKGLNAIFMWKINTKTSLTLRPRMGKSHSKRHELVDCPLFTIAR